MVLEDLAHSNLIVECHSANEYTQLDELLKQFENIRFDGVMTPSDQWVRDNPYYYVYKNMPLGTSQLATAIDDNGDVPWMTFSKFMENLEIEEEERESDLESVSLEGVL